jgi:sugar porter (SP) family MFS transporter
VCIYAAGEKRSVLFTLQPLLLHSLTSCFLLFVIARALRVTTRHYIGQQREIFVASLNFWAMFGAVGAQYCTDHYGRRRTFIVAAVGFLIGIVIMVFSNSYQVLLLGRLFVGLGVGVGLAIDPLYIAEVTPAKHRGELVTWSEIALNVGIVLGFSTGLFFSNVDDSLEWRVMFALGGILPCVMVFLVLTVMPESPRWLVSKNREDEARNILRLIYPPGYNVEPVIQDINEAIERDAAAEKAIGWGILLHPTPAIRRMMLVGIGTAVAQQAVGIDAIQYYLLDVLSQSGIKSEEKLSLILILLGLLKLAFVLVGGKCFDRRGRRPLFFISLLGMAASLLVVSIAFFIDDTLSTGATVVGLAFYLSFFSVGMGPGAWLMYVLVCVLFQVIAGIFGFCASSSHDLFSVGPSRQNEVLQRSSLHVFVRRPCLWRRSSIVPLPHSCLPRFSPRQMQWVGWASCFCSCAPSLASCAYSCSCTYPKQKDDRWKK